MMKLPPIEKIYEAYSAIADERVVPGEGEAQVDSSDHAKQYTVTWNGDVYSSNDNATYWQGYAGYPVLAVLMLQGYLPLDMAVARYFKGVNWNEINARHKSDYARAAAEVFAKLRADGAPVDRIIREAESAHKELADLDIEIKRGKNRPPKSDAGI